MSAVYVAMDVSPRCRGCGKKLAEEVTRPWLIRCPRCKVENGGHSQGVPRRTVLVAEASDADTPAA